MFFLVYYYITLVYLFSIHPDYVQEKNANKEEFTNTKGVRYSDHALYCSKIICGKCGATYGVRPWYSTSYNNPVWQCRNRYKVARCKTVNIYDMYLHFITHTVAVKKIKKTPTVKKVLMECVAVVVEPNRLKDVQKVVNGYLRLDVWDLWADEDDLVLNH